MIVPFANLYPETKHALESDGIVAEYLATRGPTDYHDVLKRAWLAATGFIVVEQDIVPWPGAIAALEACPCEWGGYAYQLSTGYGAWLGCTKFSEALTRDHPAVFGAMEAMPEFGTPRRYWGRLDTRLTAALEAGGQRMHVHWPAVDHLNPAQQFHGSFVYACGHAVSVERMRSGPAPYTEPCPTCYPPRTASRHPSRARGARSR